MVVSDAASSASHALDCTSKTSSQCVASHYYSASPGTEKPCSAAAKGVVFVLCVV
jgi:hypothetical protein